MDATHDEGDCSSASDDGGEEIGPISASAPSDITATKAASALLISASDKAGMQGIDRERINAILLRESGNSTFMQRQKKMDENTNKRIEDMRRRLEEKDSGGTASEWRRALERETIEPILNQHRGRRRKLSTCVVVDLDGFFISCHILDNPHLADIPACVGGQSMISTSNYVARKYGVRAAMPGYLGSTLVKELSGGKESLTFVKHDFQLYKRKSGEVRAILEEYDGNLSMGSLDEAYMDMGPYLEVQLTNDQLSHEEIRTALRDNNKESKGMPPLHEMLSPAAIHDAAQALLHSIRERVNAVTGLTCSAGLCSNFLLAKIASDINKPNGQHFVGPSEEEILNFINPLPIRKVNGIGRVSEKTLRGACGVETVRDLYDKRAEAYFLFKPATAQFLMRAAIGYSDADKHRESEEGEEGETNEALHRKGISHERTFTPTSSWGDMCTRLEGIAHGLVGDLRERNLRPRTVTLKVKQSNFDILSRATTRDVALFQNCNQRQSPQDLVDIVINLLKEAKREAGKASKEPFSVRLLGVRCSNFQIDEDNQSSLHHFRTGRTLACKQNSPTRQSTASKSNASGAKSPVKNPYLSPKSMSPRRGNDNPIKEESRNSESSKRTQDNSPTDKAAELPLGEPITFLTLNNLADNPGAVKKKRRIGRGIGSSKGKTCGRGHKGQKARAGRGVHPTFEGGQTKFYKRLPKKGKLKNSKFKLELIPVNVGQVQNYVTMGRLKAERSDGVITMRDMVRAGMFPNSSVKSGVKLLGDGAEWVKDALLIEVPWASASAIEAIESAGGFVTTVHYNTLAIRAHLKPHKFALKPEAMVAAEGRGEEAETDVHDAHLLPRRARPPPKYMPYYTDYAKRGYLNPRVQLERKKRGLKDILLTH